MLCKFYSRHDCTLLLVNHTWFLYVHYVLSEICWFLLKGILLNWKKEDASVPLSHIIIIFNIIIVVKMLWEKNPLNLLLFFVALQEIHGITQSMAEDLYTRGK